MAPRRLISTSLSLLVLVGAWFLFAPAALPLGSDSYAEISGISMEPQYHGGDLVIIRKAGAYKVGDIAGYHNHEMGNLVVLHRIKEITNGHYIFKGDNNSFIDPASLQAPYVTQADLVGKEWVHIPKAGKALAWIKQPVHAGLFALLAVALSFGGAGFVRNLLGNERAPREKRRRGSSSEPAAPETNAVGAVRGLPTEYLLIAAGAITAIFALLALISLSSSSTRLVSVPGYYTETGTFSYGAKAARGDVYPDGHARTGDTVFEKLAPLVALGFTYKLSAETPAVSSSGTAGLTLRISADNLWHRDIVLVPTRPFTGSTVTLRSSLHLDQLATMLNKVETATGSGSGQTYRFQLTANVTQNGRVGTQQLKSTFAPTLPLRFDKVRLYPDSATTNPDGTPAIQYSQTQSGPGTKSAPATINLKAATLGMSSARIVGGVGTLLGALAIAALLMLLRRRESADEPARIAADYGDWLVPVTHMTEQAAPYADVASFDALASLANRADRAIMHYHYGGTHTYFVKDDDVVYRYTTTERTPAPAPAAVEVDDRLLPDEHDAAPDVEQHASPDALEPLPPLEPTPSAPGSSWTATPSFEPIAAVVPVEELPAPVYEAETPPVAPPTPPPVPAPTPAPAPVAVTPPPTPTIVTGGFIPESPETAYQPAPVAMPPIVVPPQPTPPAATPAPAITPLAPITPAPAPDVALIRDTFLRPRPRPGDGNGNGNSNGA